jgi:hypothetical protein
LEQFLQFFECFLTLDIFGKKIALSLEKLNYNNDANATALCSSSQKKIPQGIPAVGLLLGAL